MTNSTLSGRKVITPLFLALILLVLIPEVNALGLFSMEMPVINVTSTINFISQNYTTELVAYNITSNLTLDKILDPVGFKDFNMGIYGINFTFIGANSRSFDIEGIGAFTNDLLHIHQSVGNVGAVDLLHIESSDVDAIGLNITTAGKNSIIVNKNISADWINAKINASYIQNNPYCSYSEYINLNNSIGNGTFFQNINPTCNVNSRGTIRYVASAENYTDYSYICMKNATNNYNWVQLAIGN